MPQPEAEEAALGVMPSAMMVYALVVVSYFLSTGGIICDVIVEPPSVGSRTDDMTSETSSFLGLQSERTEIAGLPDGPVPFEKKQ
ncbi:Oligosaccharyltransferase complex subunit OSTC [Lemmus lemmus]